MSTSDLSVFFKPHGIAVIGASSSQEKLGYGVVRNLRNVRYPGPVYPVNPNEEQILDYRVYPSVAEIPDPVELGVVIVPARSVAAQVEACGQRGIKGVIVISGGFSEIGMSEGGIGQARERELKRVAEHYGIRLLGPNCMGTIDTHTPLNTTFMFSMPSPGEIAFISQSGAMVAAVMDWAAGSGVGFSRIVSLGNQADLNAAEMLSSGALTKHTRVITGYMEGINDGRAFVAAAGKVARDMPLVFLKAGRSTSGAKAVAGHTGALAGEVSSYQAAFRRAGVLWANTMEELVDWGRALAWQPLPKGNRVAILTSAGGPAILAADALEQAGMSLAPLTADTKAFLRPRVFDTASVDNPVDILAGVGPATYAVCLDALLADETVDAVVVIQAPQDWFKPASLAEVVGEAANSRLGRQKPILTVIMGEESNSEATQILHRRRIPNYPFPERVGNTLAAMWWRKQWLDEITEEDASRGEPAILKEGEQKVVPRLAPSIPQSSRWLAPGEVEALLAAYGIPTPRGGLVENVEDALALAARIGYPVAVKLNASGIAHKTDVGGVALHIQTPAQLRREFKLMMRKTEVHAHVGTIRGVQVQRMVRGVAELIVGVTRDRQFGPLIMAGAGGTQVELRRDVDFELAPLSIRQATNLLERTIAGRLLSGFRGAPPADRDAAIEIMLQLSRIALDHPEIQEIEINPLMVMERTGGAVAVDARVLLAPVE